MKSRTETDELLKVATKQLHEIREKGTCKSSTLDFYDESVVNVRMVTRLCETCPIVEMCKQYAINFERYGIWAGLTETNRHGLRKALSIEFIDVYAANISALNSEHRKKSKKARKEKGVGE